MRIALVSIKGIVREIQKSISGVMSVSLEGAVENGLLSLTAYGGTMQGVPSGYREVEYLDKLSAATSGKFSTGIVPTVDDVEFEIDVVATTGSWYIFQAQRSTGQPIYGISGAQSGAKISFGRGDGSAISSITRTAGNRYYIKATAKNGEGTLYVKDVTNDVEDTQTFTYTFTAIDTWIGVFGTERGTCVHANNLVYYAKLKVNGTLAVNFVPARTDAEVGFYDTVAGNFVLPVDGNFEAGPDVVPTPTAPMDIVSNNGVIKFGILSKNLLDMSESNIVLGKYINNSGGVTDSSFNFYNSKYIPVKPSTTYTWSTSAIVSYLSIMEYDSNKQFLKRTLFTNGATTLSNNITLRADTAYVLLGSNMDSATITYEKISAVNRQFEEGNTATSYVPYEEGIYTDGTVETIESALTEAGEEAIAEMLLKVGDYQDEQEILSGVVTRQLGVLVLDGTEDWAYSAGYSDAATNACFYLPQETPIIPIMPQTGSTVECLCSHFRWVSRNAIFTNKTPIVGAITGASSTLRVGKSVTLRVPLSIAGTDTNNFKAWLADQYAAGTPVIILYPLATPTTEIVEGQTMNIPAGNSTIEITQASLDDLELSAKYKALP